MLLACISAAMAHWGERSYGREPYAEVAPIKGLSPPGLDNPYKHPVRHEPQQNIKANIVKEETTQHGLSVAAVNVTSWSPQIITMICKMAKDFDMLLIQEHHKIRKKDMKKRPYIIAGFAPAQKTVRTKSGKGWHTSGGVAILVRDNLYLEKR